MSIFQTIGGINHYFTGNEKQQDFVEIIRQNNNWKRELLSNKLDNDLYKQGKIRIYDLPRFIKPQCIFVEIRYQPINWWPEDASGLYPQRYLKERSIWVPKHFLSEADLDLYSDRRMAA